MEGQGVREKRQGRPVVTWPVSTNTCTASTKHNIYIYITH